MTGYISAIDGSYYEGDKQHGDLEVPQRPSADHYWENEAWVLDENRKKALLGKIPTSVFIDTVFAPPSGATLDYTWSRLDEVTRVVPAIGQKLAGEFARGSKAEIEGLAFWLYSHDANRVDLATYDGEGNVTAVAPGGIISQSEYATVLQLVAIYGVQ